ncbi:MAG TPA: MobF family relaxase [Acidimicrobiales bacterium]|nr:MobF family relaxase [Acidimicrobiales bacterium]
MTTLKGASAGAYYTEELGGYYVDGGEPAGRWWGSGAEREFELSGDVDADEFLALMAGRDPATGALLGRAYGERSARGYDITFSAPKSVSVVWAVGEPDLRAEVAAAHDAAVEAVLSFVERHAHVRPSIGGQVVVVDGRGLAVARFRQHTSRALDPQLHTHAVVVAKVRAPNGGWYALDARLIKHDQRALSALYHAGLRAELTRRLRVEWRDPVNGIAEMAGVPDEVLDRFSRRAGDVEARLQVKLDRFRETLSREPMARERWRLEREAVVDSRPSKPKGRAANELRDTWRHELTEVGVQPETLIAAVTDRRQGLPLDAADTSRMRLFALADLAERQSGWRPTELVGAVARATPTTTSERADQLVARIEEVAEEAIARQLVDLGPELDERIPVRSDGRPITESALDRRLTLPSIIEQEEALVAWAERRWASPGTPAHLTGVEVEELDAAQRVVAAAVAGTAPLVCVVGPAGAGKTTALRPAVRALHAAGVTVFGVAPSASAAAVLAGETGMNADTVDKLLLEHQRHGGPVAARYRLPAGSTLVVDEASMLGTPRLAALAGLADLNRWRVALVGDPHQLSAVDRAGMFAHFVETGPAIELERIHRFDQAWERAASKRLRAGDRDVLALYEEHGRIAGGTRIEMERFAARRWWDAHQRGESALIVTPANEAARRLNGTIQTMRHDAGQLGSRYVETSEGLRFFVGDRVVTRRNDRTLRTDRGVMVRNRAEWTIFGIDQRKLTLTVRNADGRVSLPSKYVAAYLDLGYAQTIHAAQGRTVDRCILVADDMIDGRGVYVGMTRGRRTNDALVVTDANRDALDVLGAAISKAWDDEPAIETRQELAALQRDANRLARRFGEEASALVQDHFRSAVGVDAAKAFSRSAVEDFGAEL